jgi:hypothetical protein
MAGPLASLGNLFTGLWDRWAGTGWGRTRVLLPGSRFDHERAAGDLWMNGTVAIGLNWIGDRAHRPSVRVSRIDPSTGDWDPVGNHQLERLWAWCNPFYHRQVMERGIKLALTVDGNVFLHVIRSRSGKPVQLWWVDPARVSPLYPSDGSRYLDKWRVTVDSTWYDVPTEDMVHIRRGIDPRNDRLGVAPLKALLREVCADNEVAGYTAALMRNSGVPGLMIVPDSDTLKPTLKDAEQIKERISDGFTGEGRGAAIVLGGKYKVESVGFSPEQLALDKIPLHIIAKLAAVIGVPAMAMGLPDPTNKYENVGAAIRIGWDTVQGLNDLTADAVRWQLLPQFGDDPFATVMEYVYDLVTELQENMEVKSRRIREEVKVGIRTYEEAREELGLDDEPEGQFYQNTRPVLLAPKGGDGANDGASEGTPTEGAMPADPSVTGAPVQDAALNGAQIQSLVDIVAQVVAGTLPGESARAMIRAAFPTLGEDEINGIVGPAEKFKPDVPSPIAPTGQPANPTEGEVMKAALDVLEGIKARLPKVGANGTNGANLHAGRL